MWRTINKIVSSKHETKSYHPSTLLVGPLLIQKSWKGFHNYFVLIIQELKQKTPLKKQNQRYLKIQVI